MGTMRIGFLVELASGTKVFEFKEGPMYKSITVFLIVTILLLACTTTQARVSHGYSDNIFIDTVTAVDDDANRPPNANILSTIFPNPFNPRTTIAFELAEDTMIELAIFDLQGRLVQVLEAGSWAKGAHQTTWNGNDQKGRVVPAGAYFCRISTAQGSQTKKMSLVR